MKFLHGFLLLVLISTLTSSLVGQDNNGFSIGFSINENQNDYGIGLELVSPYFANEKVAVKFAGNFKLFEHLDDDQKITWTTYQNIQLGIRARQYIVEDKIFAYGEGGLLVIFPNSKFSEKSSVLGGYGLFGVELKLDPKFGFFFEMGGVGIGARADKIEHEPIYSNGFLTNTGFRISF